MQYPCPPAGGAGGNGELSAGPAEQPEGTETAAGEDGCYSHWTDVFGEPGDEKLTL